MPRADWYFDFVSPFAYLQCEQLAALETKIDIRYRPILFAGVLQAHGHKGPAEIAAKRLFTYRFVVWQAKQLGIALKFPPVHPFNPLPLLRLAVAADGDAEVVRAIFRFVWRDGRLGDLPIEWAELMAMLGSCAAVSVSELEARSTSSDVKEGLRRNTDTAIARGIFGVPTLAVGSELFWGSDATAMATEYIAHGCQYSDPEMTRVASLPVGAQRDPAKRKHP